MIKESKNFKNDTQGTTAVEFALLAMPFMLSVIAIIEMSMFFASGMLLESAVQDAARVIKTGQVQQSSGDQLQDFLDAVCDRAGVLMNCDNIQYQLKKLNDFNDDLTPNVDDEANLQPPDLFQINQVTSGCVAMVRISYPYRFFTPFFGTIWGNYGGNKRLLMSTVVLQVEPYDVNVTDPTCSA